MSTPYTFRRPTIGRAASPPTWACYEQIHGVDDEDEHDSLSESEEDSHSGEEDDGVREGGEGADHAEDRDGDDMEEREAGGAAHPCRTQHKRQAARRPHAKKACKQHGESRERVYTLRPILTIQRSRGLVWNQDLFVPPYIKDRYVAFTSPPSSTSNGFVSTAVSSTNSALTDYDNYEVEVVEIRVQEGEFAGIKP
ncbi:hypothetical protein C8R45DRAFT_1053338 [Mycena sanguinolenta]|nr:hypothetical protein C8R45DRAFT_1053338 [Mycena sanguinolenta]